MNKLYVFAGLLVVLISVSMGTECFSQPLQGDNSKELVIDSLARLFRNNYVYPETGDKIAKHIKKNFIEGNYDHVSNPIEFASMLEHDMAEINGDKHISVIFDPISIQRYLLNIELNDNSFDEFDDEVSRFNNYYFKEVKILTGNIGYIRFNEFSDSKDVQKTVSSLMEFLKNTDAIIFDIRNNRGGSPLMVQLLISYFLDESTHLSTLYHRPDSTYNQIWSIPLMSKYNMPKKEVFILVGPKTFSAAESFAYTMKNLKRATLVGQTTGGGAHLTDYYPLDELFYAAIPTGKNINVVTNTNWEGKGVEPNIYIDPKNALDTSKLILLKSLEKNYAQEDYRKVLYKWEIERLNVLSNPQTLNKKELRTYIGKFENIIISTKNGKLFYKKNNATDIEMIPMKKGIFLFQELPEYRLEVITENNEAIAIQGHYLNGRSDWYDRTE